MGREVIDFNADATSTTNTGQAILAIDLAAFGDVPAFKARVDALVRELRDSERMPEVDRIWLPGEQSHQKRLASARDGLLLPEALLAQLNGFALENKLPALTVA
jgi:LDH2 family malate/lactate/ureidoglycolate dehydrogenase